MVQPDDDDDDDGLWERRWADYLQRYTVSGLCAGGRGLPVGWVLAMFMRTARMMMDDGDGMEICSLEAQGT